MLKVFEKPPRMFRVIANFVPQRRGKKLNLITGEEVTFVKEVTPDWYQVKKTSGQIGLAPTNYLREFDPEEEADMMYV